MDNEDDDPVAPCNGPRDPLARFTALAEEVRLIAPGELLHPEAVDFAHWLVELCACIAEQCDSTEMDGNAGEHIRAELEH